MVAVIERVREVMKKFGRIYKKQYGVEILNAVQFELESREVQPQLLQRKTPLNKTAKSLWEGFAYRHLTNSRSWKEQYLVITGDYFIACYPNKLEFKNGGSPSYIIDCTGCILLSSLEHYQSVSRLVLLKVCLGIFAAVCMLSFTTGKVSSSPMLHCPTPYPLYLWHPYRLHEYLCAKSPEGQTSWKAVIRDCTRNLESGFSRELESKTLLGAVRVYRQSQQKYGAWDMLSGTEIEVLSNLVMEEALPAVQTDILKKIGRKSPEKETTWNGVTDSIYKQVQKEVAQKYRMLLRDCEVSKGKIEALARSEYNDIKSCRKDLQQKVQAWIGPNTKKFLQKNVHPYQPSLLESIVEPVSDGFSDTRSMFVTGSSEIIKSIENGTSQEEVGQLISKLKLLPYNPMAMNSCYDKVEKMRDNHESLKERFHFSGIKSLVKETQRTMKQILDNAIYTFEQLTHHSMSNGQSGTELASRLQKAQNRVLKKFDYDSSSCRKKIFHESLVQITFPFVLSKLEPACREGLPEFEDEILTEYSDVLKLSNNFEETVLGLLSPDICEAIHNVTFQKKHSLLRDSVLQLSDSEPNLLSRLAEQPSPWNAARFSSYMPVAEAEGSLPDIVDSVEDEQQGREDNSNKATLPVELTTETRGDCSSARRPSSGEDPAVNCAGEPVQLRKQKHEAPRVRPLAERASGDVTEILEAMTVK
uniref:protein Niban 2-like n=1 Tax=Myxine glutinosa TaxID=7769 RepID=UPI00358F38AF